MTILMSGGDPIPVDRRVCECGTELEWRDCYNCEDGYSDHDCGEDCCCCRNPEPNVECDICDGDSGWLACPICTPEEQ
jgi:hypothetical protein